MKNYVWRKKAELMIQHTLPLDDDWTSYYLICHKRPFNRNLIKNHSGQKIFSRQYVYETELRSLYCDLGCFLSHSQLPYYRIEKNTKCDWKIISENGAGWAVECLPTSVPPLPDDPVFERNNYCFVTSVGGNRNKEQVIDLVKEGISEYILDHGQPSIIVNEWFSCHVHFDAIYSCSVELITEENVILEHFHYSKRVMNGEQYYWFKFEHKFKHYGKGLRKIRFCHGGENAYTRGGLAWTSIMRRHYGSKMAGACIKVVPPSRPLL